MNNFDEYLQKCAEANPIQMSEDMRSHIDEILASLPEGPEKSEKTKVLLSPKRHRYTRYLSTAACIVFLIFFAMPNLSSTYASAFSEVPLLGDVIEVLTIREYTYEDSHHEMDVQVPGIDEDAESAKQINAEIAVFTDQIVAEFYGDMEAYNDETYKSISVDHHVLTNTDRWFTLCLAVTETAASSYTYYEYYHIDKRTGESTNFGSLFQDDTYIDVITTEIKKQIDAQMAKDDSLAYYVDDEILGEDFITLHDDHKFYINSDNKLVIPFDEYEIAPGYMGCPEFEIPTKVFKNLLNNEYKGLFS